MPSFFSIAAAVSLFARSRAPTSTVIPCLPNCRAVSKPSPLFAPVIRATFLTVFITSPCGSDFTHELDKAGGKTFRISRRKPRPLHLPVHDHVARFALAQQCAIPLTQNPVAKPHHCPTRSEQPRLNHQFIVIPGRRAISRLHLHHGDATAILLLHRL